MKPYDLAIMMFKQVRKLRSEGSLVEAEAYKSIAVRARSAYRDAASKFMAHGGGELWLRAYYGPVPLAPCEDCDKYTRDLEYDYDHYHSHVCEDCQSDRFDRGQESLMSDFYGGSNPCTDRERQLASYEQKVSLR